MWIRGVDVRSVIVLIAAAALAGCMAARDGAEFGSITQTLGPPKAGHARLVVMRDKGFAGLIDQGYAVTLDNQPMGGDLKTGTFLYADAPAGRHELGVKVFAFPGDTRQEVVASAGRTYFFNVVMSDRAKQLSGAQMAGGLVGFAVVAAVTSNDKNPGPVAFVKMDEAAARAAITELRLAPSETPPASNSH
jgi:hypothetical protein